jgi:hypothetical protein
MARKSPLTDKQWADIEKRYIAGESARGLAKEYGITDTAIRKRFGSQSKEIKQVVNQVLDAERAFKSLPYSSQVSAQSLLDELRSVSTHLAGAAKFGSMTAHRLAGIANMQLDKIDEAELHDTESASFQVVKTVAGLTEVANKAAQTGINLLNANKERIAQIEEQQTKKAPSGLNHFYGDRRATNA